MPGRDYLPPMSQGRMSQISERRRELLSIENRDIYCGGKNEGDILRTKANDG